MGQPFPWFCVFQSHTNAMAHTIPVKRSRVIFYAGLISAVLALVFLTLAYTPL